MVNHLGIIMDGNRRWAKEKGFPKFVGHKAGVENIKKIAKLAIKHNIKMLTIWALSVDNLEKREEEEVKGIIKLINKIEDFLGEMLENDLKLQVIGNIDRLPEKSQTILRDIIEKTKNNVGLILNIALVYGGQDEIVRATKRIIKAGIDPDTLTREEFKKYLDTADLPAPDLIVRTGGDMRHSGFLLFDSEYSEYYFTNTKWPDFGEEELKKAIDSFANSKRNFGK
ncbi:di-trans,poly-cis-decaprenylcistransferase [Candidatus Gracilibacteria bacterium]|nr:di-trans,poly-cis-decaprenylcistransferase [Candidatus Gracilibacteria bacterium]RKW21219.1 MAG: di-trans,poly-cis-decaprenylcistransferase [Candidatus Gracilibacteria bacterium]